MSIFTSVTKFLAGFRLIDGTDLNSAFASPQRSVESGIVATGADRSDAYALRANVSQLATVAAGTGVLLNALPIGGFQDVYNDGANPVQVYAAGALTIDGTAGAVGVALANAKRCRYTRMTATNYESAQLGAVSA